MLGKPDADRRRHLRFDARGGIAAEVADLKGKARPLADDGRRVAEEALEAHDIEGGRHGDEPQILAKRVCGVQRQGQRQIIVEAAFVDLVEQHRGYAAKFGVRLDARQEHAVGHDDHARALAGLAVEPRRIADGLARLLAEPEAMNSAAARAARRRGTSSSTCPRHHSSPRSAGATLVVLPAPGRRDQQRARQLAQRFEQVGQNGFDGQLHRRMFTKFAVARALAGRARARRRPNSTIGKPIDAHHACGTGNNV